MSHYFTENVVG